MSGLNAKLAAALVSREARNIRRRLPDPAPPSSSSPPSSSLTDFTSNDYLSLSTSPTLRTLFLAKLHAAPHVLGSGGSRLLIDGPAHAALEARLRAFFRAPAALLLGSGYDANVALFSCVPQHGDVVVLDEHVHASVHDGVRANRKIGRADVRFFRHNCVQSLREVLQRALNDAPGLAAPSSSPSNASKQDSDDSDPRNSVFVAVESLYSMDGTLAPLSAIVSLLEELFPAGNAHLVVDEAHATGLYGPRGRGRVAQLGLEDRVFARLHTFGKALAASGAVLLTTPLVKDYLVNYARPLIYTTAPSFANIVAADCSFDLLEDGTAEQLAQRLFDLSEELLSSLRPHLSTLPPHVLSLPPHLSSPSSPSPSEPTPATHTPIIPLLTAHPRPLSAHLRSLGINARPITWPTVPKGKDRVRVCLHAGNTSEDVRRLVEGALAWASACVRADSEGRVRREERHEAVGFEQRFALQSKL